MSDKAHVAPPAILLLLIAATDTCTAPVPPARQPDHVRTYRFSAKVRDNGGVTPFKVGALITGTFTYDLKAKAVRTDGSSYGHYQSPLNAIDFRLGDLRFTGVGDITFTAGMHGRAEHYGIGAPDLKLPRGWDMDHTRRSQTYTVLLQNAPPRAAVPRVAVPDRLALPDFVTTRAVRLDFFHGVRFPGGGVKDRAIVFADVEKLEPVGR